MSSLTDSPTLLGNSRNYFGKIKRVLRAFGISLRDNDGLFFKIYTVLILVPFVIVYICLDFKEIFKYGTDDANSLLMFFFPFSLGCFKGLYMFKHRIKFGKLLDKLEREPFTPNPDRGGDSEEKLIEKCVWITNAQAYVYWICGIISIVADSSVTMTKRIRSSDYHDWEFTYGTFAVLNVTYSPNFEICWTYQTLSTISIAGLFITCDIIIFAVLTHISFQFQMLQNTIKQIPHNSYAEMMKETGYDTSLAANTLNGARIPWKYLKKSLAQAVEYHLAIINIADEIETVFKKLFLTIYLITLATICFLLYHASKVPLSDPHLLGAAGAVITACVQVLMLCYWGEQVTLQSQEVGRAAYETDFAGTDVRFQKSLAFIIRRSQNPTAITANNFTIIGLPTFLWIIRTSYSSFMMLRRLQT